MRKRQCAKVAAFAFLALVVELGGRALTGDVDRALHVAPLARSDTSYYPFLLAAVKIAAALALAALAAHIVRTRATADACRRIVGVGRAEQLHAPRLRLSLSLRLWALLFVATSVAHLVQTNVERTAGGPASLLAPWLHTHALPVFAVLAVAGALVWRALDRWLAEYEQYAGELVERARRILGRRGRVRAVHVRPGDDRAPRRRFGLAFECRPPPASA